MHVTVAKGTTAAPCTDIGRPEVTSKINLDGNHPPKHWKSQNISPCCCTLQDRFFAVITTGYAPPIRHAVMTQQPIVVNCSVVIRHKCRIACGTASSCTSRKARDSTFTRFSASRVSSAAATPKGTDKVQTSALP